MFIPFCLEPVIMAESLIMNMDYFHNEEKTNVSVFHLQAAGAAERRKR